MMIDRPGSAAPEEGDESPTPAEEPEPETTTSAEADEWAADIAPGATPDKPVAKKKAPAKKSAAKKAAKKADDEADGADDVAHESATSEHAMRMKELIAARRDAERLRGEASKLWEESTVEAEKLVEQAQRLATQLVEEARTEADLLSEAAKTHADALTSTAESEALRLRKEVEQEVATIRIRAEASHRVRVEETRRQLRDAIELANGAVLDLRARLAASLDSIETLEDRFRQLTEEVDADDEGSWISSTPEPVLVAAQPDPVPDFSLADEAVEGVAPVPPAEPAPPARTATRVAAAPAASADGMVPIETRQSRAAKEKASRHKPARRSDAAETVAAAVGAPSGEQLAPRPGDGTSASESVEGRPLGWLFRAP